MKTFRVSLIVLLLQVFSKAWGQLMTKYQTKRSPIIAWLYSIAQNAVLDDARVKIALIPFGEANLVETSQKVGAVAKPDFQIKSQQLVKALEELANKQQRARILKFIGRCNAQEINRQLDKQKATISALQVSDTQGFAASPASQRRFRRQSSVLRLPLIRSIEKLTKDGGDKYVRKRSMRHYLTDMQITSNFWTVAKNHKKGGRYENVSETQESWLVVFYDRNSLPGAFPGIKPDDQRHCATFASGSGYRYAGTRRHAGTRQYASACRHAGTRQYASACRHASAR